MENQLESALTFYTHQFMNTHLIYLLPLFYILYSFPPRLVAQAVQLCKHVRETHEKYQKSNNTANSKFYKSLEEGSRAHMILTKTAHKDKERYEVAKKRLNESIKELVELEFPTAGSGLSEEDYVRARENEKAVRELAEWIDSVRPIVQELSRNASTAGHPNSKNAAEINRV